jgi:hypothetical protein
MRDGQKLRERQRPKVGNQIGTIGMGGDFIRIVAHSFLTSLRMSVSVDNL